MKNLIAISFSVFGIVALSALFADSVLAQGKGNGKGPGRGKTDRFDTVFAGSKDEKSDKKLKNGGQSNRFKGLSKKLGRSPESVRAWFESEKRMNPRLTYGQFVAANMIAKNDRKGISAQTILDGLRNGDSIGQVLHRRGTDDRERDRLRRIIKEEGEDRPEWWHVIKDRFSTRRN